MAGTLKTSQFNSATVANPTDEVPLLQSGQLKRVQVKVLTGNPDVGWQASGESWVFSSWNSTTNVGVVTVPSDATTKYMEGMFVRIAQATGGTKYGMIITVTATTMSIWMPTFTLNNEAITTSSYSPLAHPVGLPAIIADGSPYKFSGWRNATITIDGTDTVVPLDVKYFDNLSMYNSSNGLFTAPKAGYYQVQSQTTGTANSSYMWASLFVNGTMRRRGNRIQSASGAISSQSGVFGLIFLNAGDTMATGAATGNSNPLEVGNQYLNYTDIYLYSRG